MNLRPEAVAAVTAVALCVLTLSGARAGCDVGLACHTPVTPVPASPEPGHTTASPATVTSREAPGWFIDRAGAGMDTGMPYYSFASRGVSV